MVVVVVVVVVVKRDKKVTFCDELWAGWTLFSTVH